MANLEAIIAEKSQQDNQWRAEMQADRQNTIAMQDAGVEEITSNPELYVKYLDMQGDNPTDSAGNIALVMFQESGRDRPGAKQGGQDFCPEYPGPGVSPHGRL